MKPQSIARALDGPDASSHPWRVPPTDKPAKTPPSDREKKLAQALRANLRRRKAAAPAQPPEAKNDENG